MNTITGRAFVQTGVAAAIVSGATLAVAEPAHAGGQASERVDFTGDGVPLSAAEYAQLLARLATSAIELDKYSRGGPVVALERQFATLLGKEAAVFMPSGTLANHLAVRALAGARRRVVVQQTSHLYNDSGDCAHEFSALTLLPLAPGLATFSWDDAAAELSRAAGGRVLTEVGAISIETPVRRLSHVMFDFATMQRIRPKHASAASECTWMARACSPRRPIRAAASPITQACSIRSMYRCGNVSIRRTARSSPVRMR